MGWCCIRQSQWVVQCKFHRLLLPPILSVYWFWFQFHTNRSIPRIPNRSIHSGLLKVKKLIIIRTLSKQNNVYIEQVILTLQEPHFPPLKTYEDSPVCCNPLPFLRHLHKSHLHQYHLILLPSSFWNWFATHLRMLRSIHQFANRSIHNQQQELNENV
jgi:hypothetical protein